MARAGRSAAPKIGRGEVGEMVGGEAEAAAAAAPAPAVHRSDVERAVAEANVRRAATPSTQAGGAAGASRDLQDFMRRIVLRMEKLDRIRSEREVG